MCIIIGGLRKNLKREEQVQGMKANPSGFYVAVLRKQGQDDKSTYKIVEEIRTLKQEEAMKIWDKAEMDDVVVTHSRIPSHGPLTLANIHGWECEGVRFMHNGTMTDVADLMDKDDQRTDSEFFFKEIFIPLWKSQGKKFTKIVELVSNLARGVSRFCFIMPDGTVKLMGNFEKDHECWFSNKTYQVPKHDYGFGYHGYGQWQENNRYGYDYDYDYPKYQWPTQKTNPKSAVSTASPSPLAALKTPEEVRDFLGGDAGIAKFIITRLVAENVAQGAIDDAASLECSPDGAACDCFEDTVKGMLTNFEGWQDVMSRWLTGSPLSKTDLKHLYDDVIDCIVSTYGDSATKPNITDELNYEIQTIRMMLRLCNTSFDWTATKLKKLVTSYKSVVNRKRKLKMIERSPKELYCIDSEKDLDKQSMRNIEYLFEQVKKGAPEW